MYRVGDNCVDSVLAALAPSNPPKATKMDVNEFRNIYGHANETLLRTTAKRLGIELIGERHACTGCLMSKAIKKELLIKLNVDRIKSWAEFLSTWEGGRTLRP